MIKKITKKVTKKVTKKIPESALKSSKENYDVEIKYSEKAIEKKLVKFIVKKGKSFEISVDELIELVSHHVNSDQLAPMLVDNTRINTVYVTRQMRALANRDFKAGEEISIDYKHPLPVEFAYIEEAYNLARIDKTQPMITITEELLEKAIKSVKKKGEPERKNFLQKFYQSFKNISLGDSS